MLSGSDFTIAYLTFQMEVKKIVELPKFQGALFRGSFGKIFRRTVCLQRHETCDHCRLIRNCAYIYLFESRRLDGNKQSFCASHDPHPFVLEPPFGPQRVFNAGESFSLGLVLFGEGIAYLPYFILVFETMGQRGIGKNYGKFNLARVNALDLKGNKEVYNGNDKNLKDDIPLITSSVLNLLAFSNSQKAEINFLTPTRMQQHGKLIDRIDFPQMVRALMRRYSWLSSLYNGSLPDLPYSDILDRAEREVQLVNSDLSWQDLERYSYLQKQKIIMGGVVGTVTFAGNIAPFLPLLRLGEYLHVGKGTAFGLGRYQLTIKK